MAFQLYLAASPSWTGPVPGFMVNSSFYQASHVWQPGVALLFSFDPPLQQSFDMFYRVESGGSIVDFEYGGVQDGDSLVVTAFDSSNFLATAHHITGAKRLAPCVARCPNGDAAPTCVTCTVGGVTVRVCC